MPPRSLDGGLSLLALFFPFFWGAASRSGAQSLAMGSPPNREGLWPGRPSPPGQSPPRWVFFAPRSPSPTLRFPKARPASLAELPPGVLVRQEPRSVLIRMGSAEFRLRQAPSPL